MRITNFVHGHEVEVLHLSISDSRLEIRRKLQIIDKLTFWKHALFIFIGIARKYIKTFKYSSDNLINVSLTLVWSSFTRRSLHWEVRWSSPNCGYWLSLLSDGCRDASFLLTFFDDRLFDANTGSQAARCLPGCDTNTVQPSKLKILMLTNDWWVLVEICTHHIVQKSWVRLLGEGAPC